MGNTQNYNYNYNYKIQLQLFFTVGVLWLQRPPQLLNFGSEDVFFFQNVFRVFPFFYFFFPFFHVFFFLFFFFFTHTKL